MAQLKSGPAVGFLESRRFTGMGASMAAAAIGRFFGPIGLFLFTAIHATAQGPAPIEGVWRAELQSEVTIQACDVGYCGRLTRIILPSEGLSREEAEAAAAMSPDEFFDYRNEDPALRSRPMQDLHLLTLRPGKKPTIFDGDIYNPQDGKTYSGFVEMTSPDTLRLNGCVLYNIICRGEDWVRVPEAELDARAEGAAGS